MRQKVEWTFKPSLTNMLILILCLGINVFGKFLANEMQLPFWMDSMGTVLSAVVCGPLAGMLIGILSSLLFGIWDILALPYMLVGIVVGLLSGLFVPKAFDRFAVVFATIIVSGGAILISAPINAVFYNGRTGNVWGDALIEMLTLDSVPFGIATILGEAFIDIPDKSLTIYIVVGILYFANRLGKSDANE